MIKGVCANAGNSLLLYACKTCRLEYMNVQPFCKSYKMPVYLIGVTMMAIGLGMYLVIMCIERLLQDWENKLTNLK